MRFLVFCFKKQFFRMTKRTQPSTFSFDFISWVQLSFSIKKMKTYYLINLKQCSQRRERHSGTMEAPRILPGEAPLLRHHLGKRF